MAYVNYLEVGKVAFVTGVGGTLAGYTHFMLLGPQLVGQQIMGVKTVTIVDIIISFIVGVATTMYAGDPFKEFNWIHALGYGATAVLFTMGLLNQFGVVSTFGLPVRVTTPMSRAFPITSAATRTVAPSAISKY